MFSSSACMIFSGMNASHELAFSQKIAELQ